jgi:hypothetical protein
VSTVIPVPTLDEVIKEPARASGLAPDALAALLAQCGRAQGILTAELIMSATNGRERGGIGERDTDRMLTADEAGAMLRRSRRWLYRNATHLPFARRLSRKNLLFSEAGLRKWLSAKRA